MIPGCDHLDFSKVEALRDSKSLISDYKLKKT